MSSEWPTCAGVATSDPPPRTRLARAAEPLDSCLAAHWGRYLRIVRDVSHRLCRHVWNLRGTAGSERSPRFDLRAYLNIWIGSRAAHHDACFQHCEKRRPSARSSRGVKREEDFGFGTFREHAQGTAEFISAPVHSKVEVNEDVYFLPGAFQ